MNRRVLAEVVGTAWLVLGGCGSAVLAGDRIGWNGVSLAFGLTVLTMAYAIGPISGCHLNPAVTLGLTVAGRFPRKEAAGYVAAQLVGGILGTGLIWVIANGMPDGYHPPAGTGYAVNGYGDVGSPKHFGLVAALVTEVVMTAVFLIVILASTSKRAAAGFAGLAIGLALTLIHLVSIPVTNTSVNPARSTGPALFAGGLALQQLWLFWVAPVVGAVVGALVWKVVGRRDDGSSD